MVAQEVCDQGLPRGRTAQANFSNHDGPILAYARFSVFRGPTSVGLLPQKIEPWAKEGAVAKAVAWNAD